MADYPESTIRAAIVARLDQGMDEETVDAIGQEVRDELAAEPPVEPMSRLQVAIRRAGGWLSTDGRREEEAFRLATQPKDHTPPYQGVAAEEETKSDE